MKSEEVNKDLIDLRNYLDDINMKDYAAYEKDKSINNALDYIEQLESERTQLIMWKSYSEKRILLLESSLLEMSKAVVEHYKQEKYDHGYCLRCMARYSQPSMWEWHKSFRIYDKTD